MPHTQNFGTLHSARSGKPSAHDTPPIGFVARRVIFHQSIDERVNPKRLDATLEFDHSVHPSLRAFFVTLSDLGLSFGHTLASVGTPAVKLGTAAGGVTLR
jgi:hypothetical protein